MVQLNKEVMKMSQGSRVKEIRKNLKLNQTEFGNRLGVSVDVVSNIEIGRVDLKPYMAKLICQTFNVSPLYLENGEGEMFTDTEETLLEELQKSYQLNDDEVDIVRNFIQLDEDSRKFIIELTRNLAKGLGKD